MESRPELAKAFVKANKSSMNENINTRKNIMIILKKDFSITISLRSMFSRNDGFYLKKITLIISIKPQRARTIPVP